MSLEQEIGELLRRKKLTLGTVESATGGLIASLITDVTGSSDYYLGSVVSYSNKVKLETVGVSEESMRKFGVVSAQVAQEMAQGGRRLLGVDICLADTGIAGPGGATLAKPVGLFYVGLAHKDGVSSRRYLFGGDRLQNKHSAATAALGWLKEYLVSLE